MSCDKQYQLCTTTDDDTMSAVCDDTYMHMSYMRSMHIQQASDESARIK
jgi:hypothetical protein